MTKTKNPFAKSLNDAKYRQRVVPSKNKAAVESKEKYDEEMRNWWFHNRFKKKDPLNEEAE